MLIDTITGLSLKPDQLFWLHFPRQEYRFIDTSVPVTVLQFKIGKCLRVQSLGKLTAMFGYAVDCYELKW